MMMTTRTTYLLRGWTNGPFDTETVEIAGLATTALVAGTHHGLFTTAALDLERVRENELASAT
jgi:hypothetical protein